MHDRLFIGTNCHVMAVDRESGDVLWKRRIHKSVNSTLVTLLLHGQRIYAGCHKRVVCLTADTGTVLWDTSLSKLAEPVTLALDPTAPGGQLFVGGAGRLYALIADSGQKQWDNNLKGLRFYPLTMRVPGAIVAQPVTRLVRSDDTAYYTTSDNLQSPETP